MEKKIIILGRIGNTEFQNNDSGKILFRGGCTKCVQSRDYKEPIKVIKKWTNGKLKER